MYNPQTRIRSLTEDLEALGLELSEAEEAEETDLSEEELDEAKKYRQKRVSAATRRKGHRAYLRKRGASRAAGRKAYRKGKRLIKRRRAKIKALSKGGRPKGTVIRVAAGMEKVGNLVEELRKIRTAVMEQDGQDSTYHDGYQDSMDDTKEPLGDQYEAIGADMIRAFQNVTQLADVLALRLEDMAGEIKDKALVEEIEGLIEELSQVAEDAEAAAKIIEGKEFDEADIKEIEEDLKDMVAAVADATEIFMDLSEGSEE